jgi:alpha-tubulin suppressor-like RCC1 family protein
VRVQGLPAGVEKITAGTRHTCAIASGAAYCWGANGHGQLGNGTSGAANISDMSSYAPVPVQGLTSGVTAISAGAYPDPAGVDMTCAIANGDVYCWGNNYYGQLGNGTTTDSSVPVKVQFP